jgi:hypothetical protein
MNELSCSGESIQLSATKDQLKNAAKTPTGQWMAVSGEEWTSDIDGFYGQPSAFGAGRNHGADFRHFERESPGSLSGQREPVRTKQGAGARDLINHRTDADLFDDDHIGAPTGNNSSDRMLQQSINSSLRKDYDATAQNLSVTVNNGSVTLRGTVASEAEKQNIESSVKAMPGVMQVNNQLNVRQ